MNREYVLATLLIAVSASYAASDDVRAKELFYSAGAPDAAIQKSKPKPSTPAQKAGSRVPATNLGLKCSIQLRNNSDEWVWVSPDRPFYSGDHIRVHVESNTTGRLTILQKQDDGTPELLFPDPQVRKNDDVVGAGREVIVPLLFDELPGKIRLFVLLRTEKTGAPGITPSEDPKALLTQAETVSRGKGLRIDVDNSGSQPAMFTVRPASRAEQQEVVATEMILDHRSRSGRRDRP